MKFLSILTVAAFLLPCSLNGQGSSSALSQLKIPVNARGSALGDGTVADAGQFSSWSLNPANLYEQGARSLTLTHVQWIQDIQSEFIGVRFPVGHGNVALAISTNSVPEIEVREKPGPAIGTFTARFATLEAGYAVSLFENVSAGVTAKYLYQKLYLDGYRGSLPYPDLRAPSRCGCHEFRFPGTIQRRAVGSSVVCPNRGDVSVRSRRFPFPAERRFGIQPASF
jgi:hypothetical protein